MRIWLVLVDVACRAVGCQVRTSHRNLFIVLLVTTDACRRVTAVVHISWRSVRVRQRRRKRSCGVANIARNCRDKMGRNSPALHTCKLTLMAGRAGGSGLRVIKRGRLELQCRVAEIAAICRVHVRGSFDELRCHSRRRVAGNASACHLRVINWPNRRSPFGRDVAQLAIIGRRDVCTRLARNLCVVVTREALARHLAVINRPYRRRKLRGVVARLACIRRGQMACSLDELRSHLWRRVAGNTCARRLRMIERPLCRRPLGGGMAVFASISRCEVGAALARNLRVVVAREAAARHLCVVNGAFCRHELVCAVARFAEVCGGWMRHALAERRKLGWRVARIAGACNLRVINGALGGNPSRVHMAAFASVRCRKVCVALSSSFDAIVAREAGSSHARMVEDSGLPSVDVMAVFANIASHQMRQWLACNLGVVVAREAGARHLCVVNRTFCRNPKRCGVAGFASVRCR